LIGKENEQHRLKHGEKEKRGLAKARGRKESSEEKKSPLWFLSNLYRGVNDDDRTSALINDVRCLGRMDERMDRHGARDSQLLQIRMKAGAVRELEKQKAIRGVQTAE
jgi:hypothetical protein